MSSLDRTLDELLTRLQAPDALNPANSDPIYYFVYPSDQLLIIKKSLPRLQAKLREGGLQTVRISLSDLMWELIDRSGRWNDWLEQESGADPEQINEAIRDVLRADRGLTDLLVQRIASVEGKKIVLLTECEMLHPFFRTRTIESAIQGKLKVPVVIFYPGRRTGQYGLHFLDFYPEDGNYRSTLIGGV